MNMRRSTLQGRWLMVLAATLAYFVFYPQDLATVLGPLEPLSKGASSLLTVSQSISPWLYGLAAVVAVCWTALRVMRPTPQGNPE